jgi:nitrilase
VIGSGCSLAGSDIPENFPSRDAVFGALGTEGWINPGDSVVVRPGGEIIAGPLHEEHGILYADLDISRAASERRTLDVVGHYARNDVFGFTVDRTARTPSSPPA